jgi:hypothetical protein
MWSHDNDRRMVTGDRAARPRVTSRGVEAHAWRIIGRCMDRTKLRREGTHARITNNINYGIRAIHCHS